jgi:hypothetical protein
VQSISAAVGAALVCLALRFAEERVGAWTISAGLCITLGGAAVVVLASGLRIGGVYGVAAAMALAPVALVSGSLKCGRSVAVVAIGLLAGLFAGGRFYPEPGASLAHGASLLLTPVLILLAAVVPGKRNSLRGVIALLLIATAIAVTTVPAALAAKHAGETPSADDPYAGYGN